MPHGPEDTKPGLGGVTALYPPRWHAFSKQGEEAGEQATSTVCRRQAGSSRGKGVHVFSSGSQQVRAYKELLSQIVLFGSTTAKSPQYSLFSLRLLEERLIPV